MRYALITALTLMPFGAMAAGGGGSDVEPTETTKTCAEGLVFDLATETCLTPEESTNDDSAMMDAVRELAHFGRYADAKQILEMMPDQTDDLVMTYQGFVTRKMGDVDKGMAFYAQALAANPDNILARSYMGQAFVEAGEMTLAFNELIEIRTRGGKGTWAETSLVNAIATGETYSS